MIRLNTHLPVIRVACSPAQAYALWLLEECSKTCQSEIEWKRNLRLFENHYCNKLVAREHANTILFLTTPNILELPSII